MADARSGGGVSLVMACGVATIVISLSTLLSLLRLQAANYERFQFGEVFTQHKRGPSSLVNRI